MPPGRNSSATAGTVTQQNLRTVAGMEEDARRERGLGERTVDVVAATVGTVQFWAAHVLAISLWVLLNTGRVPGIAAWDPWPYEILRAVLPLEALLIACTVLMIQGRMKSQQSQRTHLELQVALLAEREATKSLQLLGAIARHLNLPEANDPEFRDLILHTEPDKLMTEVQEKLVQQ